jgi:acetoin utilization deacetylase AcuC-like enzyme
MCYPREERGIIVKKLNVFYNPAQTVRDNNSFSPSAGKPEHVVQLYSKSSHVNVSEDWKPLTREEIAIAHDPEFVNDVLDLKRFNGFSNKLPSVAKSLHYTNGSFLRAAEYAYRNNTVAMSPTSGFHHSGYDTCHGYCTFNGLMIAAMHLWQTTPIQKLGIVDFDAHYGDGTQDIIDSIEGASDFIQHYTFGGFAMNGMDFDNWLNGLESKLHNLFSDCDMLFYQAGADPHIDDPLGGFLTTEQMKRRDEIVFKFAKKHDLPIVWNLAGGYQTPLQKVLDIHQNTLDACLKHYLNVT